MKYEKDLSVIIPFVGEYPQILFTIQSIAQNIAESGINFEIIAVNNYCKEAQEQTKHSANAALTKFISAYNLKCKTGKEVLSDVYQLHRDIKPTYEDKSGEAVKACVRINPWLEYLEVKDRLSHWEAKRQACKIACGKHLLFVDGHTVAGAGSIPGMFYEYDTGWDGSKDGGMYCQEGTMHLPLTYKILESHRLIYKLKVENSFYGYSFTGCRNEPDPYEVPCMSTCGMMISREIYDKIGGWPKNMGMYGGGENYINFTLSVLGLKKWIYPKGTLHHHGANRDYHYTYDALWFNRFIAHYLFAGEKGLKDLANVTKGRPEVIQGWVKTVFKEQKEHRVLIKKQEVITLDDWMEQWK